MSSRAVYPTGSASSVKIVEVARPPMIAIAIESI